MSTTHGDEAWCADCGEDAFIPCAACDRCTACCDCDEPDDGDESCEDCREEPCSCPANECPGCGHPCHGLCIDDTCRMGECCCECRVPGDAPW